MGEKETKKSKKTKAEQKNLSKRISLKRTDLTKYGVKIPKFPKTREKKGDDFGFFSDSQPVPLNTEEEVQNAITAEIEEARKLEEKAKEEEKAALDKLDKAEKQGKKYVLAYPNETKTMWRIRACRDIKRTISMAGTMEGIAEEYGEKFAKGFTNLNEPIVLDVAKKGDFGGWVSSEKNLSHKGNCWVGMGASVSDDARVTGNALIDSPSKVCGKATVSGNAVISQSSTVCENASVSGNVELYGRAVISGRTKLSGDLHVKGDTIFGDGTVEIYDKTTKEMKKFEVKSNDKRVSTINGDTFRRIDSVNEEKMEEELKKIMELPLEPVPDAPCCDSVYLNKRYPSIKKDMEKSLKNSIREMKQKEKWADSPYENSKGLISFIEEDGDNMFEFLTEKGKKKVSKMFAEAEASGKKYIFYKKVGGMWRIQACKSFGDVSKGDFGGLIDLSQEGNCWIYDDAIAFGKARVKDNAKVKDNAEVFGEAVVSQDAVVSGKANVCGNAKVKGEARIEENSKVCGFAVVSDSACIDGEACIGGKAKVFGEAFVCRDSNISGFAKVYQQAFLLGAEVKGNAEIFGHALVSNVKVCGKAKIYKKAIVHGDTDEQEVISGDTVITERNDWKDTLNKIHEAKNTADC